MDVRAIIGAARAGGKAVDRMRIPLRVVFYEEDENWIAHCLELDLIGHGDDKKTALEMLNEAIRIQVEFSLENNDWTNFFNPADSEFLQKFAEGQDIAEGFLQLQHKPRDEVSFDRLEAREWRPRLQPRSCRGGQLV